MSKHTPLPWKAMKGQIADTTEHGMSVASCGEVYGAGVCRDGEVRSFSVDGATAKANAAFIVLACNNYDRLTRENEATRKALEEIATGLPDVRAVHRLTECKIIAQRTIASLKENDQ